MSALSFAGYKRTDGRVGVRNHVLVVPTVICASVVAERIANAIGPTGAALPHLAGCGQLGPDRLLTHETLAAYCGHPNVGAVVVVALGCEQVIAQHLVNAARTAGKPAAVIAIQTEGGTVRTTTRGIEIATAFAASLENEPRVPCDASSLILCVKCGAPTTHQVLRQTPRWDALRIDW